MSEERSPDESDALTGATGGTAPDAVRDPAVRSPERDAEVADLKDRLLRALAEQENIRRRASREREDAVRFGASGLARDLLSTVDNLRRALESLPEEQAANETLQRFLAGVAATEHELLAALEKHGIRRIEPLGEPFDPYRHQAMFEVTDAEHPTGTVVQVVQPGYLHHDRLLRPAMVGVAGRGGDFAKADPGNIAGGS
jgi:molecular chaperone GrpE